MVRAYVGIAALWLAGAGGCDTVAPRADAGDGADGATPRRDAGDDGGAPAGAGLTLAFASAPHVPGDAGGTWSAYLDTVDVELADVRAVGDSAPGDARTTVPSLILDWRDGEVESVRFAQAPPGNYSRVLARVVAFTLEGTIQLNDSRTRFRIEDQRALEVSALTGVVTLEPGGEATLELTVRLRQILDEVSWSAVPSDGQGVRVVDATSPYVGEVREGIVEAFGGDESDVGD